MGNIYNKKPVLGNMRRKLIKQGKGGFTITIPIQYVREFNLRAGDELEFQVDENQLVLQPYRNKRQRKEITLEAGDVTETNLRTLLVNAYRAGFDIIKLTFKGDKTLLTEIVKEHLLGFEMFKSKAWYTIESVAEPSYEDFERIIQRQFFMILEILRNITDDSVKNNVLIVQKYDNFLKRCISKRFFLPKTGLFFWQFLSNLTQISRQCYYLHKELQKNKEKLNTEEIKYLQKIECMFLLLQKSYLSKEVKHLETLHKLNQDLFYKKSKDLLKNRPEIGHYLMYLSRIIYLANSPLTGCLEILSHAKK